MKRIDAKKECRKYADELLASIKARLKNNPRESTKKKLVRLLIQILSLIETDCKYKGNYVQPKLEGYKLKVYSYLSDGKRFIPLTAEKRGGARKGGGLKKGQKLKPDEEKKSESIQIKLTPSEKANVFEKAKEAGFSDISKYIRSRIL